MARGDDSTEGRPIDRKLEQELRDIAQEAWDISEDVGKLIEGILKLGWERPLSQEDLVGLLTQAVEVLRRSAAKREDVEALKSLNGDVPTLVNRIIKVREQLGAPQVADSGSAGSAVVQRRVVLQSRNGIPIGPVFPVPWFHRKGIPMNSGFVKTTDVQLWPKNERLALHIHQFEKQAGRKPSSQELLDIMLSRLSLPGVLGKDRFKILELSRSIASNGVRKSPIIDLDGALLDGNRRLAACHLILNSEEFDSSQRERVEHIFVWQLTEHATQDDRERVVVSLNFEDPCQYPWANYIRARKIYDGWVALLGLEPEQPGRDRQLELMRELSEKFALGPDTRHVSRFIRMVEWANEFKEHHVGSRDKDPFEVEHKCDEYFDYFDELSKGTRPGGVAHTLSQDESLKHLAFDLLYEGKFAKWADIRPLRYIPSHDEARDLLEKAREERDIEKAQAMVEDAGALAHTRRPEVRELGANTRIEVFSKWLEELPVRAFRDVITPENLRRLQAALQLVNTRVDQALAESKSKT